MLAAALILMLMPQTPTTPVAAPPADTPAPPAKPKRICRQEADTGSHISTRRCQTAAEWDAEALAIRRQMETQRSYSRAVGE